MPAKPPDPTDLSDGRFRHLLEHLPVIVYVDRSVGDRPEYVTPNVEQVLGYPAQAYVDDPWLWNKTLYDGDRERVKQLWSGAFGEGIPYEAEYRFVKPDGSIVWIRDWAHAHSDADGSIVWQGVMVDITSEKTAAEREDELRLSEERYRTLVEQLPAVIYTVAHARDPEVLYCTPNVVDLTGWTAADYVQGRIRWVDTLRSDDRERAWDAWVEAYETLEPFDHEFRCVHRDGRETWIRDSCVPVRPHDDGEPVFWQGVMFDITEEKRIQRELRDSESRYRTLVEQLPAAIYVVTDELESSTLYVSPEIEALTGRPGFGSVGMGEPWLEVVHPDDKDRLKEAILSLFPDATRFDSEYRIIRPDGSIAWVRDTGSLVFDERGNRRFWQGLLLDVTPERQAQEELGASEARHRTLIEQLPAVVYEMGADDERRTYFMSPHVEQVLGYSREEWLEQSDIWVELLHPDDREIELDAHDTHIASGEPWDREYRLIAADGREVWVRDRASLLSGPDGGSKTWLGVMLDMTRQKQLEAQLRDAADDLELRVLTRTAQLEEANELMELEVSERRRAERELRTAQESYRELLEHVPAIVYRWQLRPADDGSEHWYMSPQVEQILGYSPDEWTARWGIWRERIHPHDLEAVDEAARRSEQTGEPFALEYRYFTKDGRIVWVLDRARLMMRDAAGQPLVFQGVMLDITAMKEAERKATEAEERFRAITELGPVITYSYIVESIDPPSVKMEYVSPQMAGILGYPLAHWLSDLTVWVDMTHPDDRQKLAEAHISCWLTGRPLDIEYRMIAADGHIVWLNDQGVCGPQRDDRPRRFLGTLIDVTARAEAVEKLKADSQLLGNLVEGLPAVTWTASVDAENRWRYLYISPQALEMTGYTAEELMTEPGSFSRIVHPDDLERSTLPMPRSATEWQDSYRLIHRDGSERCVHARARMVSPLGQVPQIWQGVTIDAPPGTEPSEQSVGVDYETTEPSF